MEPADVKKVATTLKRAIKVVGTPAYEEMVKNCMVQDLSWKVLTPSEHRAPRSPITRVSLLLLIVVVYLQK